jgi:chitodextrinase
VAGNALAADSTWSFTTQPALAAPSNLTAARSGSLNQQRIDLSWKDNSSSEAGFVVERSTTSGFTTNLVTSQQLAKDTTSYRDSSLQKKTTYYYRVFAVDSTGRRSAPSNVASATTN